MQPEDAGLRTISPFLKHSSFREPDARLPVSLGALGIVHLLMIDGQQPI